MPRVKIWSQLGLIKACFLNNMNFSLYPSISSPHLIRDILSLLRRPSQGRTKMVVKELQKQWINFTDTLKIHQKLIAFWRMLNQLKQNNWICVRELFWCFNLHGPHPLLPILVATLKTKVCILFIGSYYSRMNLIFKELWLFFFTCLVAPWRTSSKDLPLLQLIQNPSTDTALMRGICWKHLKANAFFKTFFVKVLLIYSVMKV